MRVLFVHQKFPAQFEHLAPALAARGDQVVAITLTPPPANAATSNGVSVITAPPVYPITAKHPWARHPEIMAIGAEAGLRAALRCRDQGFVPDVIVAHPSWGDALFLKDIWPSARLGVYCEHFLHPNGAPPFDPEFAEADDPVAIRAYDKLRSIPQYLLFDVANAGLSPTHFQRSTYPASFIDRISVIHDGIDTGRIAPRADGRLRFANGTAFTANDEIVTYLARHLEPARGFNVFLRALPALQRARPAAHFLIVGDAHGGYGHPPPEGSWRDVFLREVGSQLDPARTHFIGPTDYATYLDILSVTRLRIYLTHPTVLSWSMLETMAAGVPVLGSDTAPIRELIEDRETGRLFPYHDAAAMVAIASELLDDAPQRTRLAANARALIEQRYDLKTVCLPAQFAWLDRLAGDVARPPLMEDR